MKYIGILALAGITGLLSGCSSWRWSGHPRDVSGAVPPRAGIERHDVHGLAFHGAKASPPFSISEAAKNAEPFLGKAPRTPDEHMQAGRAYLDMADEHRREAASHYVMKQLYREEDPDMAAHCDRLIEQLSALAAQYEDISILQARKAEALRKSTK